MTPHAQDVVALEPATVGLPEALARDPQQRALPISADGAGPVVGPEALPDVSPRLALAGRASAARPKVASHVDLETFAREASALIPAAPPHPLVEPLADFARHVRHEEALPSLESPSVANLLTLTAQRLPRSVSHRRWQTDFAVSQGARGTCWAFAGIAALEAAYARRGIPAALSEHYLFHLSKAHENHRAGPGIHSLIGFQGAADIVRHLKSVNVPRRAHAPYIDQPALQTLANSIPNTGGALSNAGPGTVAQADWFEFDLRHIPLAARWFAQFGVSSYGRLTNYSLADLKTTLAAGFDVVVNVNDKINNGGHVILIYGYDDDNSRFLIKNSQSLPGFATMRYNGDPQFDLLTGSAYYITGVRTPQTQWAAMWIGRWEIDHDGWRGRLIIRRFLDLLTENGVPPANAPISLGTWYGEDGRSLPVNGGFVDGGRGLHCTIGGQVFEIYLHGSDPYRASGRTRWNNSWFGVVLSRGTATGAGAGFTRGETIGLWDSVHDGHRGQIRVGVDPSYIQARDGAVKPARIEPAAVAHQLDLRVDFNADNRNQHFQLYHHTREDGLIGGITHWGGRPWPVEARMSPNLYIVRDDGSLNWYRHVGRYRRAFEWDAAKRVGTGWQGFSRVFGGGDGVIYGIKPDGALLWYHHDGRNQGSFEWQGPKVVGSGWHTFASVFAGDGGVIYAVRADGVLLWYRHMGRRDGSMRWQGPFTVGTGWNVFQAVAAGPDGIIYAIARDGRLLWYRHYGHDQGYMIWHGAIEVGGGWQPYERLWIAGNGFIYARNRSGELWCWRHHGFLTGAREWTAGARVGTGWGGPGVRDVVLS